MYCIKNHYIINEELFQNRFSLQWSYGAFGVFLTDPKHLVKGLKPFIQFYILDYL